MDHEITNTNDLSDIESLEIVKNYLIQINGLSLENIEADENANGLSLENIEADEEKIEKKLNSAIEKERELLRITNEKLVCELKLLDTIKQRLYEEEKLYKILNNNLPNDINNDSNKQIQIPSSVISTNSRFMHKMIKTKIEADVSLNDTVNNQTVIDTTNNLNSKDNIISTTKVSKLNPILLSKYRR